MTPIEAGDFEKLMAEVAACYGERDYPQEALKAWFRELSEFPFRQVQAYMRNWIRTKPKRPMIADILVPLADRRSDQIEAKALEEKKAQIRFHPATKYGRQCLAEIMAKLTDRKAPGKWWAYELRDRKRAGAELTYAQEEMAKKACGQDWGTNRIYAGMPISDRIPGSDDE